MVLKISPVAHQVWLSLAAPGTKLYELPRPVFGTQREKIFEIAPDASEAIEGISVFQAPDVQNSEEKVEISDRGQILDCIIHYGDKFVVVIENKLNDSASTDQARFLNIHGSRVRFERPVQNVSWRDLIGAWYGLIESELVSGAEKLVICDFLDFIDDHFEKLGPYTSLEKCKRVRTRVDRRLSNILNKIGKNPEMKWLEFPSYKTVSRACLQYDEAKQMVNLCLWPADTLTQAKALYSREDIVSHLPSLREKSWHIVPNFHFGFMASGLCWTTATTSLEEYIPYWSDEIASTSEIPRDKWNEFWNLLVNRGFAGSEERNTFDKDFTHSNRQKATPRPGLYCTFSWQMEKAENLDNQDKFAAEVHEKLAMVLCALGEDPSLIPAPPKPTQRNPTSRHLR